MLGRKPVAIPRQPWFWSSQRHNIQSSEWSVWGKLAEWQTQNLSEILFVVRAVSQTSGHHWSPLRGMTEPALASPFSHITGNFICPGRAQDSPRTTYAHKDDRTVWLHHCFQVSCMSDGLPCPSIVQSPRDPDPSEFSLSINFQNFEPINTTNKFLLMSKCQTSPGFGQKVCLNPQGGPTSACLTANSAIFWMVRSMEYRLWEATSTCPSGYPGKGPEKCHPFSVSATYATEKSWKDLEKYWKDMKSLLKKWKDYTSRRKEQKKTESKAHQRCPSQFGFGLCSGASTSPLQAVSGPGTTWILHHESVALPNL